MKWGGYLRWGGYLWGAVSVRSRGEHSAVRFPEARGLLAAQAKVNR